MIINLILILLLLGPQHSVYFSDNAKVALEKTELKVVPTRINEENVGVLVTADRFVAIDVNSGKLLLQKAADEKQPIASITKLMTALVILDLKPNWTESVTLSEADETEGAQPHLYRGEQVRFLDLWKAALVSSDNNSIMAMVRALGFSKQEFAGLMNRKAAELGMNNSLFADPTGLSPDDQSTALDVAVLVNTAMSKNEIKESVVQGKYSFNIESKNQQRTINNTDILVDSFLNKKKYGYELIGGKTGFLPEAGYCLGVKVVRDNHPVLIVVLHSGSIESRFDDVKAIADWIFSNYKW